jgi:hypothetical protein
MNRRLKELAADAGYPDHMTYGQDKVLERFAELIVGECINREELLGAIARGWCSEKNSHKTMDSDLALAIFNEVEKQIKQHFGVEE